MDGIRQRGLGADQSGGSGDATGKTLKSAVTTGSYPHWLWCSLVKLWKRERGKERERERWITREVSTAAFITRQTDVAGKQLWHLTLLNIRSLSCLPAPFPFNHFLEWCKENGFGRITQFIFMKCIAFPGELPCSIFHESPSVSGLKQRQEMCWVMIKVLVYKSRCGDPSGTVVSSLNPCMRRIHGKHWKQMASVSPA